MNATPGAHPGTAGRSGPAGGIRLGLYRNPLRLLVSASLWRSAWFLISYVAGYGWLLFAVGFTASVTAAALMVTLAGIPLLAAAAAALRWCANAERLRLRQVLTEPVSSGYRQPAGAGIWAEARARWRDPATWNDVGYLIGLWLPLFILDTAVLAVWLTFLAGITVPAWYWAPPGGSVNIFGYTGTTSGTSVPHGVAIGFFPHGAAGPGAAGLYVDTLPKALLAAACFLIVFLLFSYVLVVTARAHAQVARSVLRAPADPLAEARQVLAAPGPLGPLTSKTQPNKTQNGGQPAGHTA